eukprot:TRINITY_DN26531_c0_g1_i1.p1 TRINITY_DN26531_c0_g1~~TRINITY_DN26531_c0_g1_i1.p1  ORF type:complete len:240 (+),score=48.33 TRINITY_DN26531_c0_g1_i1:24-743(+)
MYVIVVRHGERLDYVQPDEWLGCDEGRERPWDPPLTEKGRRQSKALGKRIKEEVSARGMPGVARVVASPLLRTMETAHHCVEGLGGGVGITLDIRLFEALTDSWFRSWCVPGATCEWGGPPDSEGRHYPHDTLHPAALLDSSTWARSGTSPLDPLPNITWGSFETMDTCKQRAFEAFQASATPTGTTILVTHGAPLAGIYQSVTRTSDPRWSEYTHMYIFKYDDGQWSFICEGSEHAEP